MLWPTSLIIIADRYEVSMFIGFEWFAIDNVCWTSSVAFGAIAIIVVDSADVYSTSTVSPWYPVDTSPMVSSYEREKAYDADDGDQWHLHWLIG